MDPAFFKPRHRLVSVGDVTVKDCHNEERFTVTCFSDTGTLFMDGRFAPSHFTIGETLNWYTAEPVTDIDIEELYFDNSKINGERPAHAWEKRTFLLGHWKQYAKNDIRIRVVIRLGESHSDFKQNECVYLTMREDQTTTNNEQPPNSLIIQPFS